jgi:hypothetical protein
LIRATRDLLNILDTIAKAGAGFRSLADTWADTTTRHRTVEGMTAVPMLDGRYASRQDLLEEVLGRDFPRGSLSFFGSTDDAEMDKVSPHHRTL